MPRSPSINSHRTRKPRRAPVEERPVLQLPLEQPVWREPKKPDQPEPKTDRGVALIDFYI